MTNNNIKRIATYAAGFVLGTLALAAIAAPAYAYWDGDGHWRNDYRWEGPPQSNRDHRYYNGYGYRPPPVIYNTPYNYGYYPPPVIYNNTPGFTIRLQ